MILKEITTKCIKHKSLYNIQNVMLLTLKLFFKSAQNFLKG